MIQLLSLVFYGGSPDEYIRFVTRTFGLPGYIAQIDVAPVIPRISGEANKKAFSSFVPKFYYSYSQDQSLGVFRGKFFTPYLCGISNAFADQLPWSRKIVEKKWLEKTDYEIGTIKSQDEILAWGHVTVEQLLKNLFPDVPIKPSFMGKMSLNINVGRSKRSEVIKALERCTDCTFKVVNGALSIKVDAPKVRSKLQATLEEYERTVSSGLSQLTALEHSLLVQLSDTQLAEIYVGETVKVEVTDKDTVAKLGSIMDLMEKQTTVDGLNIFQLYRDRDRSTPIIFSYSSFGWPGHFCYSTYEGKRILVSF